MGMSVLAFWAPGYAEAVVITMIMGVSFVIPVLVILYIIRLLIRNKEENQRLRLDVGKLADELEQLRKRNGAGVAQTARQGQ